jgi:dolichyl-diphosphooligosaccharide--protein glycosyltransferase
MAEEIKSEVAIKPEIKVESTEKKKSNIKIDWKSKRLWINVATIVILAVIVLFSIWMRTQNVPDLKDVTTGNYTLGPDLDPFLYLRYSQEIVNGNLQNPDMMRMAPLGVHNWAYENIMPWAIVYVYKFLAIFWQPPVATVEFAAVIASVIFFSITLVVFFFFMKKLFSFITTNTNSTIIALIATAFYAVIPEMLHRTTGGVPELESLGMLFFWLAFLCFISAWQSDKIKKIIPLGVLAGIFTGLMIFSWGGYRYIFMAFALTSFIMFFFEKQKKKNFLIYTSWLIPSLIFILANPATSSRVLASISDSGLASVIFFIFIIDVIISNTKLNKIKEKIKLPQGIISIAIAIVLGIIALLVMNPGTIFQLFSSVIEGLLYPFGRGRVGLTVAENRAPYFVEVFGSFGLLFWIFFFGTMFLFYEATKHFDKKKKIWLNIFFIIFLITFIFSRISPQSLLNGENFISQFLYFGGIILFVIVLLYTYIKAYAKNDEKTLNDFKEINFSYILVLALIFWMIISMRGAIRLFFIISPALIIAASFLPVKLAEYSLKNKDNLYRILLWCAVIVVAMCLIITLINYTRASTNEAKYTVNGPYYQQWQKAMAWVRDNTPQEAIFVHWWDYGYWIQTLGHRATVTDGGHQNGFWDHTTARYLMTAQNEKTALQLCKTYNVSYFLIDSSDIGKYQAYSSIGSNKSETERVSWISTFALDEKQTQETKNETAYVYTGGTMLDQDIIWQGQLFPMQKAGIAAFIVIIDKEKSTINEVKAVFIYNNQQVRVPIRNVYFNNKLYQVSKDENALNSTLYLLPRVTQQGVNNMGAALYLSEKLMRSEMVKLYLLNQTDNFELVHSEPALFITQLREIYNVSVGDFLVAGDLLGPINIYKVNYPQGIESHKEYLQVNPKGDYWGELDYLGT